MKCLTLILALLISVGSLGQSSKIPASEIKLLEDLLGPDYQGSTQIDTMSDLNMLINATVKGRDKEITVEFFGGFENDPVKVVISNANAKQVLVHLAEQFHLKYEVPKEKHLVVSKRY